MKKQILQFSLILSCFAVIFTACQKSTDSPNDYTTEISAHSDDQAQFSGDMDAMANDANLALESSPSFTGRPGGTQTMICNATVVIDSLSNPRTITITYNGLGCFGNISRTGVVILSMPAGVQWRNAGAAITVTFQNLVITRIRDNKSITINGAQTYTNVSGGLLINLPTLTSITHTITSSNMSVTFDNGQRSWQVAKQRIFTYNNGIVVTVSGTHNEGGVTNISEWGTNRFGRSFTTSTVLPIVVRQDCNARITSGQILHVTPVVTASATFGLDVNGNPTSCPGTGNYYMKLMWTGAGGNTRTVILPY